MEAFAGMPAQHQLSFVARVRLDDEGDLLCFCHQQSPGKPISECQERYDCPEARIEVEVVAGTRPSEQILAVTKQKNRELENTLAGTVKSAEKIKQGLLGLEKSIKRNPRFRI